MKRGKGFALMAGLALLVAACGGSSTSSEPAASEKPAGWLESIGAGEGALNLIIWEGYAERGAVDPAYDWVTDFEAETGCKVNTTSMTDSEIGRAHV